MSVESSASNSALFKYFLKVQASWGNYHQTQRGKLQSFRNWKAYMISKHGEAVLAALTLKAEAEATA